MKFSLFTVILLVWMCVGESDYVHLQSCCLTVTNTKVPVQYIEDYTIQEPTGLCAIRAIRFLTRKGKYICSDPDDSWTIRAINDVNKRKNKRPSVEPTMCLTSTTNMIPTTTTTHETPRLKTETSTTTTQQTSVSKEKPKSSSSTAITCGTRGPTAPPTETTPGKGTFQTTSSRTTNTETKSTATTTTTPKRTKPSKLKIKILRKKSKKQPAASPIKTTHETPRLKTETSSTTTHDHPDCCLTVTNTRTPAEDIVDYHIQDSSLCPIRAVRFHTRKNRIICSDPDGSWAKRAMESVDRRMTPTDGPPATCCLKLRSTKVPLERVLNYRIQTKGLCPIKAVVIQTISGKSLCSDPNRTWTQKAMWKVDKGREQDPVPAEGASADGSRGRADPVKTSEPPLKRRQIRVKPRQKSKKEKSKTSTKAHKGPKEKRPERGGVKRKNKKRKN